MAATDGFLCELCATVPTGFESGAAEEVKEVLGREAVAHRGKISFKMATIDELHKVHQLRAIDKYYVVVKVFEHFCQDESTVLQRLEGLADSGLLDMSVALSVWKYHRENIESMESLDDSIQEGKVDSNSTPVSDSQSFEASPTKSQSSIPDSSTFQTAVAEPLPPAPSPFHSNDETEHRPTFRVTCSRAGRKHCFSSMQAAGSFGAGLVRRYHWKVQMKNADLEVLLHIMSDSASVGVALSTESQHRRNIIHFGPTTLRSTIAYGLLRLANIAPGDVVMDPMCGGASISIEGTLAWPATFHLAGDSHELAIPRAAANVTAVREKSAGVKVDVFSWDACRLPLRTASVDVVVTDMPFGKRSGSKQKNWELYPAFLEEAGRVCRPSSSRAILLTHDTKVMGRAMYRSAALWRRQKTIWINIGGLTAGVYILHRTATIF